VTIPSLDWLDEEIPDLDKPTSLAAIIKASFGGDRSAAGRYAAEQRWKNHQKKEDDAKGRGGGGSLDDEIRRVSGLLQAVGNLPPLPLTGSPDRPLAGLADRVVELSDYENSRGSQFVDVVIKGKTFTVVSQAVIEAEQEVNALGKRVMTEVTQKLVADGKVTQQELDDAIRFQSAPKDESKKGVEALVEKAMRGDDDVPDEVREAAIGVSEAKANAKEAKSALIKATKAYNEARKEEDFFASSESTRALFQARREAKNENILARARLADAEYILEARAARATGQTGDEQLADGVEEKRLIANSIRVQGLIGAELQSFLSSRRQMGEVYPAGDVTMPRGVSMRDAQGKEVDVNARAGQIMGETARRFPEALLSKTTNNAGQKVELIFGGRGGSYNERNNRIISDIDDADTLTHETVHNISYHSRETRLIEQAGLQRRIFGKEDAGDAPFAEKLKIGLQKTIGATKALGYKMSGTYVEDEFVNGYQGRVDYNYGSKKDGYQLVRATEILTVSTENAFGGNHRFKQSGKLDADLLNTAVGWLLTAEGGA
jgi:PAS domain-containing protein